MEVIMFGVGSIIKALSALIIVLTVALGVYYVSGLRAQLAVSEENSKKLSNAVEQQKEAMDSIIADQKKISKINNELNETIRKQAQDVNSLRDRFSKSANGESRDIGKTAVAKPEAIQNVINKASAKALRCMEIASGSPLTKEEQNETNSECPALTGSSK
jgi:predicted nuclease with TOPRIM domain